MSKINKTLSWLCSKPHNEQEKNIKFCIGQAQKMKLLIHIHELNIAKEQDKRLFERDQKKDSSFRRKLQKKYRVLQKQCRIVHRVSRDGMNPT